MHHETIYAVVRRIPRGKVATYGQIAALAGSPRAARQVGYALAALAEDDRGVPWHRVVNAQGKLSLDTKQLAGAFQRSLLESEGVELDGSGRIQLTRFQWRPPSRHGTAVARR